MVLTSALFTGVRVLQVIVALPVIGMLGYFVHPYVDAKQMVPDALLTLFIVSILACAWALLTLYQFNRYRSMSGPLIAVVDILFVGAWIAGIVLNRGISGADCSDLSVPIGVQIGNNNYSGGDSWSARFNKNCAMYKASWILAIIDCVLFFVTCLLSWSLYRSYRYASVHTTSKHHSGRRSTSTHSSRRHHRHSHV